MVLLKPILLAAIPIALLAMACGDSKFGSSKQDTTQSFGDCPAKHLATIPDPTCDLSLRSVTPSTGRVAGGDTIQVNGNGFTETTAITLDGQACSVVDHRSSTVLTCTTPGHIESPVDVKAANDDGSTWTLKGGFTYVSGLSFAAPNPTVAPFGTLTLSVTGGISPYTYSILTGLGTLGASTGIYNAPSSLGAAIVRVTDSLGDTLATTITIKDDLYITPTTQTVSVNASFAFTAWKGTTPYTFTVKSGGGVIGSTTGIYTAPATQGTAIIEVTDKVGGTADATVTIGP